MKHKFKPSNKPKAHLGQDFTESNFYHLQTVVRTRLCTTAPVFFFYIQFQTFIFFIPYRPIYLYCAAEHMAELFSFSFLALSLAFAVRFGAQWKPAVESGIVGDIMGEEKVRLTDRCSEH